MFRRKVHEHPSSNVLSILDGDTATANEIAAQIDFGEAPDVVSLMEVMSMFSNAVTEAGGADLPEQTYRGLGRDQFAALLALLYETAGGIAVILDGSGLEDWAVDDGLAREARDGLHRVMQALFEIVTNLVPDED